MATPSTAVAPDAIAQAPSLDLTHLLTSNNVPLDSEIPFICDIISDGMNQVQVLNNQMGSSEPAPAQLTQNRDEIVEHIRQHRAILSPVRRVPQELVREILVSSLSGDDGITVTNPPPWELGHICRYWRHAVLACPALWSCITLPSFTSYFDEHPLLPMIETQLIRSGNAPLDVRWSASRDSRTPDPRSAELVLVQCSRWKALRLSISYRSIQLDWLRAVNGRLAALETFEVAGQFGVEIPDIFSGARVLRNVDFGGRQSRQHCPTIPWAQITQYSGIVALGEANALEAAAGNLLHCAVTVVYSFRMTGPPDKIRLSCLRYLFVHNGWVLRELEAPLLEELKFGCAPTRVISSIPPFVRSSGCQCSLRKLVLMDCTLSSRLVDVLRCLPSLTYLLMEDGDQYKYDGEQVDEIVVFDAMTIRGNASDDRLCPNLTSLVYGFGMPFASDCFFAMVRSRLRPNDGTTVPLTHLGLFRGLKYAYASEAHSVAAQTQRLRDEGFDVTFVPTREAQLLRSVE